MILKLAIKQICRQWGWSVVFVLSLAISLSSILMVLGYKTAIQDQLSENAQKLLGADLLVSARRELSLQEITSIRQYLDEHKGKEFKSYRTTLYYDFFAMLQTQEGSRLVGVRAVDSHFPLVGKVAGDISLPQDFVSLENKGIAVYSELQNQFGTKRGDLVQLGKLNLNVVSIISKDDTQGIRAGSIAPRVYISRDLIAESGLLSFGSTFSQNYAFAFEGISDSSLQGLRNDLLLIVKDPAVQVESYKTASEDSGRQLNYLSDYLGLIALVSFILSLIGAVYLLRDNFLDNQKSYAIYKTLGMKSNNVFRIELLRIAVLGFISSLAAVIFMKAFSFGFEDLIFRIWSTPLHLSLSWIDYLILFLLSPGVLLIFQIAQLNQISNIKPISLILEGPNRILFSWIGLLAWVPGGAAIFVLSFWFSNSFVVSGMFLGILILSGIIVLAIGYAFLSSLLKWQPQSWQIRYGLVALGRARSSVFVLMVTLGLGTLMMALPLQLKDGLKAEFEYGVDTKVPDLFMFDIQDEQINQLQEKLSAQGFELISPSPLIRSRITKVNGVDFERKVEDGKILTREQEREIRFRNRGINLSFREKLTSSENIVEGQDFSGKFSGDLNNEIELSVEEKYADRLGWKIGDHIEFDIMGVAFKGKIVNFRKVKWTSFSPNFFILVQPGALVDAPKTWIMGLKTRNLEQVLQIQKEISGQFPNVSIVDVRRTVNEVLVIASNMLAALQFMAAIGLVTGFAILYSLLHIQIRQRRKELNLVRILGARQNAILVYTALPFLFSMASAVISGAVLSGLVVKILLHFIFELRAPLQWQVPALSVVSVATIALILTLLVVRKIFSTKPVELLY